MLSSLPRYPLAVALAAMEPMNDVVLFLPAAYTSSSQLFEQFDTIPKVMFLRPDLLPVSQLNVMPKLGSENAVLLFLYCFSKYGR